MLNHLSQSDCQHGSQILLEIEWSQNFNLNEPDGKENVMLASTSTAAAAIAQMLMFYGNFVNVRE